MIWIIWVDFHDVSLGALAVWFELLLWMILLIHLLLIGRLRIYHWRISLLWDHGHRFLDILAPRLNLYLPWLLDLGILNEALLAGWSTALLALITCGDSLEIQCLRHFIRRKIVITRSVASLDIVIISIVLWSRWRIRLSRIPFVIRRWLDQFLRWSSISRANYHRGVSRIGLMNLWTLSTTLWRPRSIRILNVLVHLINFIFICLTIINRDNILIYYTLLIYLNHQIIYLL